MRTVGVAVLSIAFLTGAALGAGVTLPPPPAGFKTMNDGGTFAQMRAMGVADRIEAEKPNPGWPNCIVDPKIDLTYGWSAVGSQQNIEMMAKSPEDPVSAVGGIKSEPAGKQRYKGGVMWWRKNTQQQVGTNCGALVTYSGSWAAYASGKMLSVSVARVYGSKQAGQALLDSTIDKLVATMAGAH